MSIEVAAIIVLVVSVIVPWAIAELVAHRRNRKRFVKLDPLAARKRAIAHRGRKSLMRNHREYGL